MIKWEAFHHIQRLPTSRPCDHNNKGIRVWKKWETGLIKKWETGFDGSCESVTNDWIEPVGETPFCELNKGGRRAAAALPVLTVVIRSTYYSYVSIAILAVGRYVVLHIPTIISDGHRLMPGRFQKILAGTWKVLSRDAPRKQEGSFCLYRLQNWRLKSCKIWIVIYCKNPYLNLIFTVKQFLAGYTSLGLGGSPTILWTMNCVNVKSVQCSEIWIVKWCTDQSQSCAPVFDFASVSSHKKTSKKVK